MKLFLDPNQLKSMHQEQGYQRVCHFIVRVLLQKVANSINSPYTGTGFGKWGAVESKDGGEAANFC